MIVTLIFHAYSAICSNHDSPYFYSMVAFCMLFANMIHHCAGRVIRSASSTCRRKGQSCRFFQPLYSLQECSGPLSFFLVQDKLEYNFLYKSVLWNSFLPVNFPDCYRNCRMLLILCFAKYLPSLNFMDTGQHIA
jgi:hypothetical protein